VGGRDHPVELLDELNHNLKMNTWGYAPICSDLGTSAQKCPKSEVAV
jgi:hypothetical protein